MKNIMLIAVATLTIATANADAYNWPSPQPMQIVNNTNVTLEGRTEPDNVFFTLQAGTSMYAPNASDTSTYLGWGIDTSSPLTPVWNDTFDGSDAINGGTMASHTSNFQGDIWLGQIWSVGGIGSNDVLSIDGWPAPNGAMYISITRTRGPNVVRIHTDGSSLIDTYVAQVFCLSGSTGTSTFGLGNIGDSGRCPIGSTDAIMANYSDLVTTVGRNSLNDWTPILIADDIRNWCIYNVSCQVNPHTTLATNISGELMYGFNTIPYSSSNNSLYLKLTTN